MYEENHALFVNYIINKENHALFVNYINYSNLFLNLKQ